MTNLFVRKGTKEDIPACEKLAEKFWATLDHPVSYDKESVEMMFGFCVQQELLAVAVDDEEIIGCIAGLTTPCIANMNVLLGAELIWWVEKEYRKTGIGITLVEQIERQARERDVVIWSMGVFAGFLEAGTTVLERIGYEETERTFMKIL